MSTSAATATSVMDDFKELSYLILPQRTYLLSCPLPPTYNFKLGVSTPFYLHGSNGSLWPATRRDSTPSHPCKPVTNLFMTFSRGFLLPHCKAATMVISAKTPMGFITSTPITKGVDFGTHPCCPPKFQRLCKGVESVQLTAEEEAKFRAEANDSKNRWKAGQQRSSSRWYSRHNPPEGRYTTEQFHKGNNFSTL
eukprot:scaffold57743_cov50-Cyclotella_meneghiniana.AAC.6